MKVLCIAGAAITLAGCGSDATTDATAEAVGSQVQGIDFVEIAPGNERYLNLCARFVAVLLPRDF